MRKRHTCFYGRNTAGIRFDQLKYLLQSFIISTLIICFVSGTATAQDHNEWPMFRGVTRDGKTTETGLLKKWPENGPKLLWSVSGLGIGFATVTIAEGHIFTAGREGKNTYVFAHDMNGKLIWRKPNGIPRETNQNFGSRYIGSRGIPTYSDGIVYHTDEYIQMTAFDYKTGETIWYRNLQEDFDSEHPEWGFSESVLIEGDRLYCSPGGKKGFMACLNKKDGSLIWTCKEISGYAGHSTSILTSYGGYDQLINMSPDSVFGVNRNTGKLLWQSGIVNRYSINITDPVYHNGYVFVASAYGAGCMLLKLNTANGKVVPETVWKSDLMDNHHGGVILHDGYLYGSGDKAHGWFCLDFMTGKQMWKTRGKGSIFYADGMFYCLEEKGTLKLVKATHEKYEEVSSFKLPSGGEGMYWAHPVVFDGCLYIRHADKLFVYDVKE